MSRGAESGAIFDRRVADYDAWYDTPGGAAIFADELAALRPLVAGLPRPWLEVGIGGGRFAASLGVECGVDPARGPLRLATRRGCRAAAARGETLPFLDGTFGAVLFVVTLCFVADPLAALREARRVLRPGGGVVLGVVPADGPWGRHYQRLGAAGHPTTRRRGSGRAESSTPSSPPRTSRGCAPARRSAGRPMPLVAGRRRGKGTTARPGSPHTCSSHMAEPRDASNAGTVFSRAGVDDNLPAPSQARGTPLEAVASDDLLDGRSGMHEGPEGVAP